MTGIEGIRLDGLPRTPQVRKKMPPPYARPSVSLGGGQERRQWRTVMAADLKAGDTVPGIGLVTSVKEQFYCPPPGVTAPVNWTATVTGGANNQKVYPGGEPVWAFAVDPKETSDDGE